MELQPPISTFRDNRPTPPGSDYEQDGNKEAFASKHALFFRSIFVPSLATALDRVREGDAGALRAFGDCMEEGLKRRLARQPAAMHSPVQTIVLRRHDGRIL